MQRVVSRSLVSLCSSHGGRISTSLYGVPTTKLRSLCLRIDSLNKLVIVAESVAHPA